MAKKKIGEIYDKPIVIGDKNLVTENEIHVDDLGGTPGGGTPGGGETGKLERNDVNFFDYDGTLLYAYTWEEAKNLKALPALPTHEGFEVREWNYTLEDIKAQGTETTIGKVDIGACCYNKNGEQVMTNGAYIIERGVTSIDNDTVNPGYDVMAKVMSIPATVNYISNDAFGRFNIEHLRMPINAEYGLYYGKAFSPIVIRSLWINGCDLNTNIIDSIGGLSLLHIPHTFSTMEADDFFTDSYIIYVPETIHTIKDFQSPGKHSFVIFDNHKFVPTLTNFYGGGSATFIVPDVLYDEWINATNWSELSSLFKIRKISEFPYLINN